MKKLFIILFVLACIFINFSVVYASTIKLSSYSDIRNYFDFANEMRLLNNLEPFEWEENLNNVAQLKADDMVIYNYFNHYSSNYKTPFNMLKSLNFKFTLASETILSDNSISGIISKSVSNEFVKQNLLSKGFTKMGVGVCENDFGEKFLVSIFIREEPLYRD